MLSSDDFPTPMETPQPEVAGATRPPMMGTPVSRSIFPPSQASHSVLQSLPPPPPPPPSTSVPQPPLILDQKGTSSAAPDTPPPSSFPAPKPTNPLKRCDDDVQFLSEKPVKRRKLGSPIPSDRTNAQAQPMPDPQTGSASPNVHSGPVQRNDEASSPPVCDPALPLKADLEHTSKPVGPEETAETTSLHSLENYVFPTGLPSGPAASCKDSPQLSPRQTLSTEPPNPSQSADSQPEVVLPHKSQEPLKEEGGSGGTGAGARSEDTEDETTPLRQSNQMQQSSAVEPTNVMTALHITPVSTETTLTETGSAPRHNTPNTDAGPKDGPLVNHASSHRQSTPQEPADVWQQHGTAAPSTILPLSSQPGSLICDSATTRPQNPPAGAHMHVPDASISSQLNPTNGNPLPPSNATSSVTVQADMLKAEDPGSAPSVPKAASQQPMAPPAPAGSQMPRRSPTQYQAQPSAPFPARQQAHIHPQAHAQAHHRAGLHPPEPGPSKAHCRICIARRQQAALQRAALGGDGRLGLPQGTLPSGAVPQHTQAQTPNGTPYNVVFVPTRVQGGNGPIGSQSSTQPNQSNAHIGMTGMPSHPYMAYNHQQGNMARPAPPCKDSRPPRPSMASQPAQPRPVQHVSPPQNPAPRKFAHQEPSPGKHIIVDIADTAMEVFPFNKIAQRHNVPVDKIRNIFEAVVAIPFLRVPADKRRAAKIGQERVRNYLNTKKEVEKARAVEGREGGQVTVYDMATAMGPEEQPPKVLNGSAPGFRGPW